MERKTFLSLGVLAGSTLFNFPADVFAKPNKSKESLKPFTIPKGKPLDPGPGNLDIRTIIHSKQTGNQYSNIEVAVGAKQMGPSPHIHKELDQLMFVLEGTATVLVGEEIFEVQTGSWNFCPHGTVYSFWNASDKPLRFIDSFFNQNFEDYLDELFHQVIPYMVKNNLNPASPEIVKRIISLDKKFGIKWFHEQRQGIIAKYGLVE